MGSSFDTPSASPLNSNTPIPTSLTSEPSSGMSCPPGHYGLKAWLECTHYYHCVNGVVTGNPFACPTGTLFSESLQICDWESNVQCDGSARTTSPSSLTCPSGYTGLRPWESCSKYYHCVNGFVTGEPLSCASGTLFNEILQNCDWNYNVQCDTSSEETIPPNRLRTHE